MLQVFDYHNKKRWHYFCQDHPFLNSIKWNGKDISLVQLKKKTIEGWGNSLLSLKSQNGWKYKNKTIESCVRVYIGIVSENTIAESDLRALWFFSDIIRESYSRFFYETKLQRPEKKVLNLTENGLHKKGMRIRQMQLYFQADIL